MNCKKMSLGEAICVMEEYLDDAEFPLDTKINAIEMVANMETHNSTTKTKLVNALRFLFKTFDFEPIKIVYHKPMTNADRIRAMTDEELRKALGFFTHINECLNPGCGSCGACEICELCELQPGQELEWLQQPVKGDAE